MGQAATRAPITATYDAIIVGAGFAGMYQLYRFREMGLKCVVIEAGDGVGGTWYWNRYPGARCDVTSVEYSYSWSKELEQEWEWSELMASQPEIERYLNHVVDRFDLRKDVLFQTRVLATHYNEAANRWKFTTDRGDELTATYAIMATGCLSMPLMPDYPGIDSFKGVSVQTSLWPKEGVELEGKRVAVIGTGSSAVQSIPEIGRVAKHMTVFQRTPAYTWPSPNRALTPDDQITVKTNYESLRERQRNSVVGISGSFTGALIEPPSKKLLETPEEERREMQERFGFVVTRMFADIATNMEANELARRMYGEQLRKVVKDPVKAAKLTPTDYPIGCKRGVIDAGYFETFNQDNVDIVDLREESIEAITERGVRTTAGEYEFDVIVYATGFDAMTGALNKIDIRGRGGEALRDRWAEGPRAYLGLMVSGFPNLFTITGPGSPSVLSNMMVSIEQHVDMISEAVGHMRANHIATMEPADEAEESWMVHVNNVADGTMYTAPSCNSWYLGANVPGKTRQFMPYIGGVGRYRKKCEEIVANGYQGFVLQR